MSHYVTLFQASNIQGGESVKLSSIDQKIVDICLRAASVMWSHKGLLLLIFCWIYLFWVGTFGCETEFGILLTLIALCVMLLCIICPSIFV